MSSQKYDVKIREAAEKALAAVPPEHLTEARVTRDKLYAWLHNIVRIALDPTVAVAHSLKEATQQKHALSAEVLQEIIREILHGTWTGGSLASRTVDGQEWVPTSFFYDPDTKALNVKVGQNPYQPIAYDNGEILVQLETAKLLWSRSWAICLAAPVAAPFDVIVNVVNRDDFVANDAFLSEDDLKGLDKAFQELGEEFNSYLGVDTDDKKAMKEADFRLRETLKLARIWSPVTDAKLKQVHRARSGLGPNFENAPIAEVVRATLEFMAFRKDSYLAMMKQASTSLQLSPMTAEERQHLVNECVALRRVLTGEVIVVEVLTNLLSRILAVPSISPGNLAALEKEPDAISRAKAAYNLLAHRLALDALPVVGTSAGVDGGPISSAQAGAGCPPSGSDVQAGTDGGPSGSATGVSGTSAANQNGSRACDSVQP